MTEYVLSAQADLDLDAIFDYIERQNPSAAERYAERYEDRLFGAFETLARHPLMGHERAQVENPALRF